jgi:hypothetical protein
MNTITDDPLFFAEDYKVFKAENKYANMDKINKKYTQQMSERHAFNIDKNFWMVVKEKPKWMPSFLYRAVIKELVQFEEHRF